MPQDVVKRILELAGGPDAKIVALSTGHAPERARREGLPSYFVRAGAKNITLLPARGPEELSSPEVLNALKNADCVWFGGGRQWRFVDAYDGTPGLELFHEVLERGGVICGSSAGASIQGEYLARADAVTNRLILAEGYERGFNFLPGTAIDQHFAQRNRFGDLSSLVSTYPQYLGIGIDEATAIIVRGEVAEVMGRNKVHFFDANLRRPDGKIPHISLAAGATYQLAKRLVLNPAVADKPAKTGD
jgi:cyanophycinase